MRVALVNPRSMGNVNDTSAPLGLAFLASYLRLKVPDVELKIIDGATGINVENEIFLFQPDIIGVTGTTAQAESMYALADSLKRSRPDFFVVLGGVHVSVFPNEAVKHCDVVVVGEGEEAFRIIVEHPNRGLIPQILHGVPVENLDDLPMPAYDLLDMAFYFKKPNWLQPHLRTPIAVLITSRGCPYRCTFCYNSWRSFKVRYFSAKRVLEEILFFHNKYGVCDFDFVDDEFLINVTRLKELCELFKSHGVLNWIRWGCQARVTTLTPKVVSLIEKMGCRFVAAGFESCTPRILKYLKAGSVTVEDQEKAVKAFHGKRVVLGGNFIFGTFDETLAEMEQTWDFFESHSDMGFLLVNVLTPYPGTKVWDDANRRGLIPDGLTYGKLVATDISGECFNVCGLPEDVFKKFLDDIFRRAYVFKRIRQNPSMNNFVRLCFTRTGLKSWVTHPKKMLRLLRFCSI